MPGKGGYFDKYGDILGKMVQAVGGIAYPRVLDLAILPAGPNSISAKHNVMKNCIPGKALLDRSITRRCQ
jgi:hypothetical protein